MKITYHASFNFTVPAELQKEMPMPSMNFKAEGSIDCTQDEYLAALKATVDAAKEAAEAWRPVAVRIVNQIFCNSFASFCSTLWEKARLFLNMQFGRTVENEDELTGVYADAHKL